MPCHFTFLNELVRLVLCISRLSPVVVSDDDDDDGGVGVGGGGRDTYLVVIDRLETSVSKYTTIHIHILTVHVWRMRTRDAVQLSVVLHISEICI